MSRHGGGSIINTSSDAGIGISAKFRPADPPADLGPFDAVTIGQGSYGAAKAGVWHFTKEMAMKYARYGVRVNCISPGYMATPLTLNNIVGDYRDQVTESIPMGRFGQAEDVAAAVAFFACDDSRYLTGHLITVDGGYSVWGPR
jgi:NAD(P)-dependent dehydrogenase (short-subunit alcohol dehydrogenase family)